MLSTKGSNKKAKLLGWGYVDRRRKGYRRNNAIEFRFKSIYLAKALCSISAKALDSIKDDVFMGAWVAVG